jgi:aspartyl-tRNA(Asn)/glutamyl-tRNA(Gln) amidotransferase subunit A
MAKTREPFEVTIAEACSAIAQGKLTPSKLLESCLERIDAVEDKVKAWACLDRESAVKAAKRLDQEVRQGKIRGLLHGIPIGIKDIIYVAGLPNECGSKSCAGFIPAFDATVVARLKKAGAIILGKTHTTEYAYFDPTETRNPWGLEHTPGGSSSGSAAGVAARMFPAALGSQTLGSILRPAAYNGIVGFKAEHGRVSTYGVVPVSWNLDHVGVLARTVEDAAIVFQVIAGYDSRDLYSLNEEAPDCLSRLETKRAPRIGLMREYFYERVDDDMRRTTDEAAKRLQEAGAKVEEVAPPASLGSAHPTGDIIIAVEAAAVHEERFAERKDRYGPGIRGLVEKGLGIKAGDYARALHAQRQQRADALPLFDKYDAILTPGAPSAAPRGMPTGKPLMQAPWTVMRIPTIALPTALNKAGLPLGIQLAGAPKAEDKLLSVARWCEKALDVRLGMPLG